MTKIKFPYQLVKKNNLKLLQKTLGQHDLEIQLASFFVKEIEKGNLNAAYTSDPDVAIDSDLAKSLVSMRDQMNMLAEQEKERNWVTEGLAQFVEILRANNNDLPSLSDSIIKNLVKYLGANQGGLFIVNDEKEEDSFIELVACYAYEKKKFLNKRIELREGLVGQCIQEADTIYLTDIPKNYVSITSGLGQSTPTNLLIVPLKVNEQIFGVVEIASFLKIKKYQVEFVEKLGESIASAIATVKINDRTKKLLEVSQIQAEEMRAQEEEMRQNMEELQATQEAMHRKQDEVEQTAKKYEKILEDCADAVITINETGLITFFNKVAENLWGYNRQEIIGKNVSKLMTEDHSSKHDQYLENYKTTHISKVLGKGRDVEAKRKDGSVFPILLTLTEVEVENGMIFTAFIKDITVQKELESQTKSQLAALHAQEQELQIILNQSQEKEVYVTEVLNLSGDSILTIDKDFKVISSNKAFSSTFESRGIQVGKGFDILTIFTKEEQEKKIVLYNKVFAGESIEIHDHLSTDGFDNYFVVKHAPVRNADGVIASIAIFAKDVTEITKSRHQSEKLMNEAQQQTEELKAQEEELRQNMEELAATQDDMEKVLYEIKEKEYYLNKLINSTDDSILTVDREYKIVYCNEALQKAYIGSDIIIGKGFEILQLIPEEKRELSKSYYDRALAGESHEITEAFTINGNEIHLSVSYTPIADQSGEIIGVAIFSKDVTELVLTNRETQKLLAESQHQTEELSALEEELRQNMEEMQATNEEMERMMAEVQGKEVYLNKLINATDDSILTLDREYKIVYCNEALQKAYVGSGIIVGKGFEVLQLIPEDKQELSKSYYDRALAGESLEISETFIIGGKESHLSVSYTPIADQNGEIVGLAIFSKDVTELVLTNRETQKLLAESQHQTEELSALEEELRQNMEEMQATHEEMERMMAEVQSKEVYLNNLINATDDSILTIDRDYRIVYCNDITKNNYSGTGLVVEKGFLVLDLFTDEQRLRYKSHYDKAFSGESFEVSEHYQFENLDIYYSISYAPIYNENKEIIGASVFAKNISKLIIAGKETEKLLTESIHKSEELQAIEEELRQNMEEMQATHEEMERVTEEAQNKEAYLNALINGADDCIATLDKNFRIEYFNDGFVKMYEKTGFELKKGFDIFQLFTPEQKKINKEYYKRALAGESFSIVKHYEIGVDLYASVSYSPLKNKSGEISGIGVFVKDITELMVANKHTEKLLTETQQKSDELQAIEEELRQNLEEVQATQEELSRKNIEIEEVRKVEKERADNQINAQKKLMESFTQKAKSRESELLDKITYLETLLQNQNLN